MSERAITGLATLQFSIGGVFDAEPIPGHRIHLVRSTDRRGTPGPTLCGIDRFAPEAPGWSVGGGVTDDQAVPCPGCVEVRGRQVPRAPRSRDDVRRSVPMSGHIGGRQWDDNRPPLEPEDLPETEGPPPGSRAAGADPHDSQGHAVDYAGQDCPACRADFNRDLDRW